MSKFLAAKRRGQFFSADFLFAGTVVLLLLAFAFFAVEKADSFFSSTNLRLGISSSAADAAAALVQSAGVPSNWQSFGKIDSAQIKTLGLASERAVLDYEKTARFFDSINRAQSNSNYSNASLLLGLRKAGFDYSLSIYDSAGATLFSTNASVQPELNNSVSSERLAVLNDSAVRVKLTAWTSR